MNKALFGWGAVVVAVLMAFTQALNWSRNLNYVWAALVLIWGIIAFSGK